MYYRIWDEFNQGGSLKTTKLKNNIQRNTDGWVESAEKACTMEKVLTYMRTNCEFT
jgi:hypothetical protein